MKILFTILGFLAFAAVIMTAVMRQRARDAEAKIWSDLSCAIPAQPIAPEEAHINDGALSAMVTPDGNEVGSIRLANGDAWRFAFRSHHCIGGSDSFAVFAGPSGTCRVRGAYFCCEVQVPDEAVSKSSTEFVAFLRDAHPFVELTP